MLLTTLKLILGGMGGGCVSGDVDIVILVIGWASSGYVSGDVNHVIFYLIEGVMVASTAM